MFTRLLIFVSLTAAAAATEEVVMHLLEQNSKAVVNLYRLHTTVTGVEYPLTFTVPLAMEALSTGPAYDYYISTSLIYSNLSVGANSTLWHHWAGFDLQARRFTLRETAPLGGAGSVACVDQHAKWSCVFDATVDGQPLQVALFQNAVATKLPTALYSTKLETVTLYIPSTAQSIRVPGPFEHNADSNTIVVGAHIRHDYNFEISPHGGTFGVGRMRVTATEAHRVTELEDMLLTLLVVYASLVVVYTWAAPTERPGFIQQAVYFPLAFLPWLHIDGALRAVQLALFTGRGLFSMAGYAEYSNTMASFMALECLYTATIILHESTVNMASSVVSAAIAVTAWSFVHMKTARNRPWLFAFDSTQALLATANFVINNGEPYIRLEFEARYGMDTLPIVLFVTALLFEVSLHLHSL